MHPVAFLNEAFKNELRRCGLAALGVSA